MSTEVQPSADARSTALAIAFHLIVASTDARKPQGLADEAIATKRAKLIGEMAAQMLAATESSAVRNRPS